MKEIRILGAGPAGLASAITMARAGRDVVVYERAQSVGTRHDGDFEGLENWTTREDVWEELTRWGIRQNFRCTPLCSGTLFAPGFEDAAPFDDADPIFYFVKRGPAEGSFDRGLLQQALEAGVKVEFGRAVKPDEVDIVASGFDRARAFAVGYNFNSRAPNGAHVLLDDALAPHAYAYLVFCEGEGTVATAAFTPQPGMKENLARVVEGFQSRLGFEMREPKFFAASVGFGLPGTAQRNGKLFVGEAGGFQDYVAGFGMRMGMTTGVLAAQSILEQRDYDSLWREKYLPLIKAAAVDRYLLETFGNRGYRLIVRYLRRRPHSVRAILHRHYNPIFFTPLFWLRARKFVQAKMQLAIGQDAGRLARMSNK